VRVRGDCGVCWWCAAGVGGQIDFMRGAALGADGLGKPILAMPSATKRGESKIVPVLKPGLFSVTLRLSPAILCGLPAKTASS